MNKLEETLENFVKNFYGNDIIIELDDFLNGKLYFYNTDIKYDKEIGFLKLLGKSKEENNNLELNVLDINHINYTEKKLELNLDNSQNIKIYKK